MEGKKKLKIITPKEISSVSIKNVSSAMTLDKLQKMTELLTDSKLRFYFNNLEININDMSLTIEEIFQDLNEIVLEIKVENDAKLSSRTLLNAMKSPNACIPIICKDHPNENLHYFCDNCNESLCFRCCLTQNHKQHIIYYKMKHFEGKWIPIEKNFERVTEIYHNKIIEGDEIKSKTMNYIDNQFEILNLKINEMKKFTYNFFEEFFESYEFESNRVGYENERIEKTLKNIIDDVTSKNISFNFTMDKLHAVGKNIDLFTKHIKSIENYFACKKDMVSNFQSCINKIAINLEKNKSSLFDENTLKFYDDVTLAARESKMVSIQMKDIINNSGKSIKLISMPIPQTKKVLCYNFDKNQFEISLVPLKNFKFFDYCRFLDFDNYLVFTGGMENDLDKNLSFIYNLKESRLNQMTEMVFPRAQHTLFYLPKYLIFAIGGYNNLTTEIYDMRINTWFKFKELNTYRSNSNILILNDYLFVFGGSDGEKYLSDKAERIKIRSLLDQNLLLGFQKSNFDNFEEVFEPIKFILRENIWTKFHFSGSAVIYINQGEIRKALVLGGYNAENEGFLTDCIKVGTFSEEEANVEFVNFSKLLISKSCFYNQNFHKLDENTLVQLDARGNVIILDRMQNEFSQIKNTINL